STPLNISTSSSSNPSTTSSSVKDFKAPNSIQEQLIFMAKQLSKITNAIENINLEKTNKESLSSSSPSSSSSSSSS
ncbi:unnamed protein product, partial [Rotaria magnacalcarata]